MQLSGRREEAAQVQMMRMQVGRVQWCPQMEERAQEWLRCDPASIEGKRIFLRKAGCSASIGEGVKVTRYAYFQLKP